MKENVIKLRKSLILQTISILAVLIYPVFVMVDFYGNVNLPIFDCVWIAFYSCLFLCLIQKGVILKIFFCILNFLPILYITLLGSMVDGDIYVKVLIKAVIPFAPIIFN